MTSTAIDEWHVDLEKTVTLGRLGGYPVCPDSSKKPDLRAIPAIDHRLPDISPDDDTSEVAKRTLVAWLGAVQHYLPLAGEESADDIEHVHHLRVWTPASGGGAGTVCRPFAERRAAWMAKQLKRLRRATNEARDLDVLAHRLEKGHVGTESVRWLEKVRLQRVEAQKPIVAIHERLVRERRLERRIRKLLGRVHPRAKEPTRPVPPRFGDWARVCLRPIVEQFFEAMPAEAGDPQALHQFRISGKELRYALELLAGAFPADIYDQQYALVETLQDRLGAINDLVTAQARLRRRIQAAGNSAEDDHLRQVLAGEEARLAEARQDFRTWWTPQISETLRAGFDAMLQGPARPRRPPLAGAAGR
jgi:CHAD domain-containing protein